MSERELEKPEECYACGYETDNLKEYSPPPTDQSGEQNWFCELCACTMSARAYEYPAQFDGAVLRTICYVGNVILDELRSER